MANKHMKRCSMSLIIQFSSVAQSCPTLCNPMNCSMPGLPVHHQLPEFTQTHVHWVRDAIQPSHPLSSPSPPAPNPSQHQSLFQWVNSSHEVAKVLEFLYLTHAQICVIQSRHKTGILAFVATTLSLCPQPMQPLNCYLWLLSFQGCFINRII